MDAHRLRINGADLTVDLAGPLWWPAECTLVVADLHLEKGSGYAPSGQFLPPYDSQATLAVLAGVVEARRPDRVICLGDSFHDVRARDRLSPCQVDVVRGLTGASDWIWVTGNHDPAPPADLGGRSVSDLILGPLIFRHEARETARGEISGHYHPKARVRTRLGTVSGRCFVTDGNRLILPALGAYAGGLDARSPAIARLMNPGYQVILLGRERAYRFPAAALSSYSAAESWPFAFAQRSGSRP